MTNNDPLLVEKSYGNGRVMLAAVPLDASWRTNLTTLPAFVPLAHELVYYLGGVRAAEHNLQPGQPIRYRPDSEEGLDALTFQMPEGEAKPLQFRECRGEGHLSGRADNSWATARSSSLKGRVKRECIGCIGTRRIWASRMSCSPIRANRT